MPVPAPEMAGVRMMRFEELHPIVSTKPEYFQVSRWTGHIPFGMLLVDLMRPRCFVELGTHYGVSYMAFCQAVKMLNAGTRCYAVDTWTGDPQAGAYSDEVLSTLRAHHDPAYGSFSTLMQMSFDEAAEHFDPGSIDLLHIDGCHQYEAVRHDFETWRPRLSDQAVVLFHDTMERNEELRFGVWRLWEELSAEYPAFNFTHEHGLGVLAVGKNYASSLDAFFGRSSEEQALIRGQFCELGFQLKNEELLLREAGELRAQHQSPSEQFVHAAGFAELSRSRFSSDGCRFTWTQKEPASGGRERGERSDGAATSPSVICCIRISPWWNGRRRSWTLN